MAEITRVLIALIVRVGVDLAKNVIQVHAVDGAGRRVVWRAIKREQFLGPGARSCLRAGWWRWKHALGRNTGLASCARWAWMHG